MRNFEINFVEKFWQVSIFVQLFRILYTFYCTAFSFEKYSTCREKMLTGLDLDGQTSTLTWT